MKTKISKQTILTIVKYLRDFSIVVAGIAVTLYVNYKISNRSEKRDLKLYMSAVKLELEENVRDTEQRIVILKKSVRYAYYLRMHDKESLNADTIQYYQSGGWASHTTIIYKSTAFEMLKTSGVLRLVDDKVLLLSIWDAYHALDNYKNFLNDGYQIKLEELNRFIHLPDKEREELIPMYQFYAVSTIPDEMLRLCREVLEQLKETVEKMGNAY
jgi:hypothetical protein